MSESEVARRRRSGSQPFGASLGVVAAEVVGGELDALAHPLQGALARGDGRHLPQGQRCVELLADPH